jgi:23S rRNA pseudouridine1911/1915/1917 synthase
MKYERSEDRIEIFPAGQWTKKTVGDFLDEFRQSKKNRYILVRDKLLLLDDVPVSDLSQLLGDHKLTIMIPAEEPGCLPAEEPCRVVYEDAFVYIVHKEPGVIIHGGREDTTCLNAMAARYQLDHNIRTPVRPVHRLDRETAGLVLYSKIPFFQPWFDEQMAQKKIRRHYLAVCKGTCRPGKAFDCTERIGRDRHRSGRYIVSPTGETALTHVECLKQKGYTVLMGCTLETGRTHQIRVHLSHHKFPIVNDELYGVKSNAFRHMGLWADEITFRSPLSNKKHRIHDLPNEDYAYFEDRTGE